MRNSGSAHTLNGRVVIASLDTLLDVLVAYVPVDPFPVVPLVPNGWIVVPSGMPVPMIVCPSIILPTLNAVTVRVPPDVDAVNWAGTLFPVNGSGWNVAPAIASSRTN